jgi:UPF0716 protein FxsA
MLFLVLLFIVLPLAELYVIIQVADLIGLLPTIGLMFVTAVVGGALARSQGRNTWRRFNDSMRAGRMPAGAVLDGAMIIFGGALLLSPGFITDVLGIGLLLPPGRRLVRLLLKGAAARTAPGRPILFVFDRSPWGGRGRPEQKPDRDARRPPPPGSSGEYDIDGTAQEISESDTSLEPGQER